MSLLRPTAIITWKAGLFNLWIGCTTIALTDKASALSDVGAIIGSVGVLILAVAIVTTFALGVRALLVASE